MSPSMLFFPYHLSVSSVSRTLASSVSPPTQTRHKTLRDGNYTVIRNIRARLIRREKNK